MLHTAFDNLEHGTYSLLLHGSYAEIIDSSGTTRWERTRKLEIDDDDMYDCEFVRVEWRDVLGSLYRRLSNAEGADFQLGDGSYTVAVTAISTRVSDARGNVVYIRCPSGAWTVFVWELDSLISEFDSDDVSRYYTNFNRSMGDWDEIEECYGDAPAQMLRKINP